jgi:hypothetical protein
MAALYARSLDDQRHRRRAKMGLSYAGALCQPGHALCNPSAKMVTCGPNQNLYVRKIRRHRRRVATYGAGPTPSFWASWRPPFRTGR